MTRKEMVELVKLHHPQMGEKEIVNRLNRAKDSFCEQTELVEVSLSISGGSVANQTYYQLSDDVLKIKDVWLNRVRIPRILQKPIIDDEQTATEG